MFLLFAAPEWIFWPLYINIPANMGVSPQRYCSNWFKSTKRFTDPHLGTFCSRIVTSNFIWEKKTTKGVVGLHIRVSITLKRRHIKQTSHKRSTVVSGPWSAAIKGCFSGIITVTRAIGGRLWLPVFHLVLRDLTWTSLGDWTSQQLMCQVFCRDKWAALFSCLSWLFAALRLGLSGRQPPLIIIFCMTACTDNPPFHATSVPVSAPLLPSVCPDLLKPELAPQFIALWAW